jgi:hypothetical protein
MHAKRECYGAFIEGCVCQYECQYVCGYECGSGSGVSDLVLSIVWHETALYSGVCLVLFLLSVFRYDGNDKLCDSYMPFTALLPC